MLFVTLQLKEVFMKTMMKLFVLMLGVSFLAGCSSTGCKPCAKAQAAAPVATVTAAPVETAAVAAPAPVEEQEPVETEYIPRAVRK